MVFAAAFFLWLLPLAALPVIFHLLLRRRQKRLDFPDLMFFFKADPRLHARRRLREILLLAARVILLLVLVLALSRPVLRNVPAVGGRVALAIVVDNSASMDGPASEGQSKLDLAREAARLLLDAIDDAGSAAIIPLVADPVLDPLPSLTPDRETLHRQLARIRRTDARGSTASALARVRSVLNQAPAGVRRAVHVFSDLHTVAWDGMYGDGVPFDQTDVVVHRIPGLRHHAANIAVDSLTASPRILLPGQVCTISVGLRNSSAFPGDVRVTIRDSQDKLVSGRYTIASGMSEHIRYAFTPDEPGEYWIMAELEGDAFRGDNRAGMALLCRDKAPVWFIGDRAQYGLMPLALSPPGNGRHAPFAPVFKDPDHVFPSAFESEFPAMLVATWSHLSRLSGPPAEALRGYVASGGRLLAVPDVRAPDGERLQAPDWLDIRAGPVIRMGGDSAVGRILDPASEVWNGLHAALDAGRLRFFLMHRFVEFEAGPDYRLLAGITPRRPVLLERVMGAGRLYAAGMAWDRQWTSWATDPSGIAVIMLHNIARSGLDAGGGATMLDVVAGEPLPIPATPAAPVEIRSLAGDTLQTTVSVPPVLARAGAYRMEAAGQVYLVSVRGASEEAADTFLDAGRIPVLGAMPHHVVTLSLSGQDLARHLRTHFTGRSLFAPLAILALLVWGAEAWLSTLGPHSARQLESGRAGSSGGAV